MDIQLKPRTVPILYKGDVVVVGGSLLGVSAALELARAGRRVTLVEPRTYLGREVTATLRYWIDLSAVSDRAQLPQVISACLDANGISSVGGEYALQPDRIKACLEDQLLDAGVTLVYASLPVDLCTVGSEVQGVVIGNKSGRQVLSCRLVLDATATALVARLAGAAFEALPTEGVFRYTIECDDVGPTDDTVLPVPEKLGVIDDQVVVHRGCRGEGHMLVELAMSLPHAENAFDMVQRDLLGRAKAVDVAAYLFSQMPAFYGAHLATLSYEPSGAQTSSMTGGEPGWAVPLASCNIAITEDRGIPLPGFAGPVAGLWCANAARMGTKARSLLNDPVVASALGACLGRALHRHWPSAAAPAGKLPQAGSMVAAQEGLQVKEPSTPRQGHPYRRYPVAATSVPVCRDVDVLVVGGGSSGTVAAIESAREGLETCLADMNPGLGGTGTYGGVDSYWVGHRGGFVARAATKLNQVHDRLNQPRPDDLKWPSWNIEAKIQAWIEDAQETGGDMLLNAFVIGAVVEGNQVRGVVAATRAGPVALLGKIVVDATGDGDVAAFAGADHVYGSERDHATMWYSLAQFTKPGQTQNNFSSTVDISNVADYTRAILTGRRLCRTGKSCHEHGIYIAPRESRHIRGDVTLTLTDHLLHRSWPDTVYIAFSNTDVKGQVSSDWMRIGLVPPQLEIEIPYRALLPKGLENILVIGKALSATRDSEAAIRMQSDMENVGGVAALAAAIAVQQGRSPRAIDVRELQSRLVEAGVLHESVLTRELVAWQPTDTEVEDLVHGLHGPLCAYSDMELDKVYKNRLPIVDVCCAGPRTLSILEREMAQAEGDRQVLLAQALALMESRSGVPTLVSAIQDALAGNQLPGISASVRHFVNCVPDQAAMPDAAYLIYSLGMARDRRSLPVWQQVVDLLAQTGEEDVCSPSRGTFHYVDAVCYGAEQLGDPAAIPALKQLHSYPQFHGKTLTSGFQDNFVDERAAYLEVVIGRALARCGSPEGLAILIGYLGDVRAFLAEHAHDHLVAVTGEDLGKDVAAWSQWLEEEGETLEPVPWPGFTEPKSVWHETILVPRDPQPEPRVSIYRYRPGRQPSIDV